jgi:6-phosphofructokinase 1
MPTHPRFELPSSESLAVPCLGEPRRLSPLTGRSERFVSEQARVLVPSDLEQWTADDGSQPPCFEPAGPRERIFFDPAALTCGVVTCGGLCPGLNDVIRALVLTLHHHYGVPRILGYRYGYAGLAREPLAPPMELDLAVVDQIHQQGGTLLGSSRGEQHLGEMVETLVRDGVGILFTIGGDGTLRGAQALHEEIRRRGLPIAVVGIPKTIDNDLLWTERSFGFATAVEEASRVVAGAHVEARGAWNGVGLVKLMGRHSGFIAAHATLASSDVNFCLIPEVPFSLDGEGGFLGALARRLEERRHAVVVVAEGAGQELLPPSGERDASGNVKLADVGQLLKNAIRRHCGDRGMPVAVKYIDPSYTIRSLAANALDSELSLMLGQHAVHAGMAGRTGLSVGYWNQRFTHVPLTLSAAGRRQVDPRGNTWQRVLGVTGQPVAMNGDGR